MRQWCNSQSSSNHEKHALCDGCRGSDDVLYYSVRSTPSGGPRAPPLTGPKIESDLPTQEWDERLLGQIDSVEAGTVSGWACLRGQLEKPLQVCMSASSLLHQVDRAGISGSSASVCFCTLP